jgi:hypothetical protein
MSPTPVRATAGAALLALAAAAGARDATLVLLDRATYPLATCNDGTMAGYYVKKGTSATDWLVFQQGGGWCWDEPTCASRRGSPLSSSKDWPATRAAEAGSLFDAADANLAAMSFAYAPYCSSDGWAGSTAAAPPTNFAFRGHDIVAAIFADLAAKQGLGSAAGTRVMYGGCSAGARGALFNLDRVALEIMPAIVQKQGGSLARVGGLLDSAFWMVSCARYSGLRRAGKCARASGADSAHSLRSLRLLCSLRLRPCRTSRPSTRPRRASRSRARTSSRWPMPPRRTPPPARKCTPASSGSAFSASTPCPSCRAIFSSTRTSTTSSS